MLLMAILCNIKLTASNSFWWYTSFIIRTEQNLINAITTAHPFLFNLKIHQWSTVDPRTIRDLPESRAGDLSLELRNTLWHHTTHNYTGSDWLLSHWQELKDISGSDTDAEVVFCCIAGFLWICVNDVFVFGHVRVSTLPETNLLAHQSLNSLTA